MQPTDPNEEERLEELDQDQQTPFQPADPSPSATGNTTDPVVQNVSSGAIPADHPTTDTDMDSQEMYDAGIDSAAGTSDDSQQSAVTSYDPDQNADAEDEAL